MKEYVKLPNLFETAVVFHCPNPFVENGFCLIEANFANDIQIHKAKNPPIIQLIITPHGLLLLFLNILPFLKKIPIPTIWPTIIAAASIIDNDFFWEDIIILYISI